MEIIFFQHHVFSFIDSMLEGSDLDVVYVVYGMELSIYDNTNPVCERGAGIVNQIWSY